VLFFIFAIVLTSFTKNIRYLAILYLFSVALAYISRINVPFFIKRVWFFIPLFTLFIAIPAIFTQGALPAAVFVLRVAACVSFAVLLTITTKHDTLFKALRSFGVPDIFIQTLDMTYRYIFLFVKVFEEMHVGLKSRLVRNFGRKNAREWISSRVGFLFRRSVKMSEDVYMAMIARGYSGENRQFRKAGATK
jgi:cobalt/nickel transport system permease protein